MVGLSFSRYPIFFFPFHTQFQIGQNQDVSSNPGSRRRASHNKKGMQHIQAEVSTGGRTDRRNKEVENVVSFSFSLTTEMRQSLPHVGGCAHFMPVLHFGPIQKKKISIKYTTAELWCIQDNKCNLLKARFRCHKYDKCVVTSSALCAASVWLSVQRRNLSRLIKK